MFFRLCQSHQVSQITRLNALIIRLSMYVCVCVVMSVCVYVQVRVYVSQPTASSRVCVSSGMCFICLVVLMQVQVCFIKLMCLMINSHTELTDRNALCLSVLLVLLSQSVCGVCEGRTWRLTLPLNFSPSPSLSVYLISL